MLRQSATAAAFRESILRSSKGFQYLHTRDFVTALRGKSLITEDGEAIEGEALDDVAVIGVVKFITVYNR